MKSLRSWATLCVLLAAALLLCHDPFLLLWWPEETKAGGSPLGMATNSIDDMYDGCQSEMAPVIHQFGVFEWQVNKKFSVAWAAAESGARKPAHQRLKDDHATVMYMYTKMKNMRRDFDRAVRTGKHQYGTPRFEFHYFYFFLADAVRVLRQNQTSCGTTYHRTRRRFGRDVVNADMRFGAFTWAAASKQSFGLHGNVSCFEIYSCFGADITDYSATKQVGQVLIPPYEVFKITDVLTNDPWCSAVYRLRSTEVPRSDLNCKLNPRQIKTYSGAILTHWHAGIISAGVMLLIISSCVLIKLKQKCFVAAVLGALQVLSIVVIWRVSH